MYIILITCGSPDEKQRVWEEAHKHADQLHPRVLAPTSLLPRLSQIRIPTGDTILRQESGVRDAMSECLLAGVRNCIKKPVNYEKIRGITQGKEGNPVLLRNRLVEAFRQCTNWDPSPLEGGILVGQHFLSQSTPDICRKLHKLQMGPQAPPDQLMDTAFLVFNNRDLETREMRKGEAS